MPGTLTIPKGIETFPVVVLVHGSGPNDRNESIGGSKMFRDLAVGLANEGIAVLHYDKRTYEYGLKSQSPYLTAKEETIDDALAAVQFVKSDSRIRCGGSICGTIKDRNLQNNNHYLYLSLRGIMMYK